MDKFRLRRFVEKLDAMGEVETLEVQTDLSDIAVNIGNNPNVGWFKNVGPEGKSSLFGPQHKDPNV